MPNNKLFSIGLAVLLVVSLISLFLVIRVPGKINDLNTKVKSLSATVETTKKYVSPMVYVGEPVGFVIEFENGLRFYFAADTGLIADFKVIGDFYKPDAAFIPIGNVYTMDYRAGAYAANMVNPSRYIIPNHYASFPMLEQDPTRFFKEIAKYKLRAKPVRFVEGEEQELAGVKIVWLGHSTWRFVSPKGVEILIDPQFAYNPKFPEPWKDMSKFSKTNLVLLSHGHFDHTNISDIQLLLQHAKPYFIAPYELGIWLKDYLQTPIMSVNKGSCLTKIEAIGMGIPAELVEAVGDIKVYVTSASHSSGATPLGEKARY